MLATGVTCDCIQCMAGVWKLNLVVHGTLQRAWQTQACNLEWTLEAQDQTHTDSGHKECIHVSPPNSIIKARGGGQVSFIITFCCVPLRQDLWLVLEFGRQPENPSSSFICPLTSPRLQACECTQLFYRSSEDLNSGLHSGTSDVPGQAIFPIQKQLLISVSRSL